MSLLMRVPFSSHIRSLTRLHDRHLVPKLEEGQWSQQLGPRALSLIAVMVPPTGFWIFLRELRLAPSVTSCWIFSPPFHQCSIFFFFRTSPGYPAHGNWNRVLTSCIVNGAFKTLILWVPSKHISGHRHYASNSLWSGSVTLH